MADGQQKSRSCAFDRLKIRFWRSTGECTGMCLLVGDEETDSEIERISSAIKQDLFKINTYFDRKMVLYFGDFPYYKVSFNRYFEH